MAVEFRLPDLGEGMVEAEVVRWLVKPGDRVALDQMIAEVQTDKAVVEIPSPAAGVVLTLAVEEGQVVPVETLLLTIEDASQDGTPTVPSLPVADQANGSAAVSTGDAGALPVPTSGARPDDRPTPLERQPNGAADTAPRAAPSPAVPAATGAAAPGDGSGGTGRWTAASVAPQRRALATPAVRRLAREMGLDITTIRGAGPAGRVLAEDLRAASAAVDNQPKAAVDDRPKAAVDDRPAGLDEASDAVTATNRTGAASKTAIATMPGAVDEGPDEERLPLRGLRRRIAENMVLATTTIPQVTSLVEIDASGLVALRRAILPAAEARGVKLSYLPFIVKALTQALRAYPYVNAGLDDATKEIVLKRRYHIGIATATPDGLLVPVLRHADRLTVLEIAVEVTRLAEAGRARKLPLEELRGSTFTVSNYGTVGGFFATPIINPGEAGILGLGRIVERPWVVDGRVEPRPLLPLSFTADHRLIDGELAMRFLNTLTATLENPNLLLLDMR